MIHHATSRFWACYEKLPAEIRDPADADFAILKETLATPRFTSKK